MATASSRAAAQHLLQRLQLVDAVDVELRLGEGAALARRRSGRRRSTASFRRAVLITQVPASRSPTRIRSLLNSGKNRNSAGPDEAERARSARRRLLRRRL